MRILDDDRPTISLAADATSITEGEPVTFTLTRANATAVELIVGVTVDDPGGFLEGNDASPRRWKSPPAWSSRRARSPRKSR